MFHIQPAVISLTLLSFVCFATCVVAAEDTSSVLPSTIGGSKYSASSVLTGDFRESLENELDQLVILYIDAQSAGMIDEADTLAKRIVVVSIQNFGRDSKDTAAALINLADFQAKYGDPITAIQNFEAAIDIVERVENGLSMDLVNPLNALGNMQFRSGNSELAKTIWQRAIHISHVNLGPHNNQQIETLYSMEKLLFDAGKDKQARRMRRRIRYLEMRDDQRESKGVLTAGVE